MNSNTSPAFEIEPPASDMSKGEREYLAFRRLLPQLLAQRRGQYVAIHEGQVIDCDANDIDLVRRVHARIGYVPIHVGLVNDDIPVIRLPHYRTYRPKAEQE